MALTMEQLITELNHLPLTDRPAFIRRLQQKSILAGLLKLPSPLRALIAEPWNLVQVLETLPPQSRYELLLYANKNAQLSTKLDNPNDLAAILGLLTPEDRTRAIDLFGPVWMDSLMGKDPYLFLPLQTPESLPAFFSQYQAHLQPKSIASLLEILDTLPPMLRIDFVKLAKLKASLNETIQIVKKLPKSERNNYLNSLPVATIEGLILNQPELFLPLLSDTQQQHQLERIAKTNNAYYPYIWSSALAKTIYSLLKENARYYFCFTSWQDLRHPCFYYDELSGIQDQNLRFRLIANMRKEQWHGRRHYYEKKSYEEELIENNAGYRMKKFMRLLNEEFKLKLLYLIYNTPGHYVQETNQKEIALHDSAYLIEILQAISPDNRFEFLLSDATKKIIELCSDWRQVVRLMKLHKDPKAFTKAHYEVIISKLRTADDLCSFLEEAKGLNPTEFLQAIGMERIASLGLTEQKIASLIGWLPKQDQMACAALFRGDILWFLPPKAPLPPLVSTGLTI
jgi:hypothetical protein